MKKVAIYIAVFLCIVLTLGQIRIGKNVLFPKRVEVSSERAQLNTKNTVRVNAESQGDLGREISNILFPTINEKTKADGFIVIQSDDWRDVLSIAPLVNQYNSPILVVDNNEDDLVNYIKNSSPKGISSYENSQVILFSKGETAFKNSLEIAAVRVKTISYKDTNELLNKVYEMQSFKGDKNYGFIVSDDEPLMSIPIVTWIINQGGTVLFIDKDKNLYEASKKAVANIKLSKIYIVGRKNNAKEELVKALKVPTKMIYAYSPESLAVNFAKFYDEEEGIGWGANRNRQDANHNFILAPKDKPTMALLAGQLSLKGKIGPLLWTDSKKLSSITENYLWRMKPNYWNKPAEGPFNSLWIVGDNSIINFHVQAKADFTQEIVPYRTMGEQGVSGLEAIAIIHSFICILGALWIALHLFYRVKNMFILTKLIWIINVLLLGPIGILFYVISYYNLPWIKMNGKVIWLRPLWKQTAVATIVGLSLGTGTITVVNYILTYLGPPLVPFYGRYGSFLLGNSTILKLLLSFIVAFFINSYIFMPVVVMEMKGLKYKEAVKEIIPLEAISMTAIFIGIILSMWWLNMVYSPNMLAKDNILWFGFIQLAVFIGGLIAYIPNWFMVRLGKKIGTI